VSVCRGRRETGRAYYTNPEGDIFCYRAGADRHFRLEEENMRKDYFGQYYPADSGSMATTGGNGLHPQEKVFYGVHGQLGLSFRFDPSAAAHRGAGPHHVSSFAALGNGKTISVRLLGFTLGRTAARCTI
jgi:hypothetical protein